MKLTLLTSPSCPLKVRKSSPLFGLQHLIVLSEDAVARRSPSGLMATDLTRHLWLERVIVSRRLGGAGDRVGEVTALVLCVVRIRIGIGTFAETEQS